PANWSAVAEPVRFMLRFHSVIPSGKSKLKNTSAAVSQCNARCGNEYEMELAVLAVTIDLPC
ncbi:hypothetical protein ACCT30_24715, partial [Rhizobium ruizarguesonis]